MRSSIVGPILCGSSIACSWNRDNLVRGVGELNADTDGGSFGPSSAMEMGSNGCRVMTLSALFVLSHPVERTLKLSSSSAAVDGVTRIMTTLLPSY